MNPKVQSVLSYIGILWLIAYFGGKSERNEFSIYHLKQGFGFFLVVVMFNALVGVVARFAPAVALLLSYVSILFLIIMVFDVIHAVNEVKKPLPIMGRLFENKFDFIKTN